MHPRRIRRRAAPAGGPHGVTPGSAAERAGPASGDRVWLTPPRRLAAATWRWRCWDRQGLSRRRGQPRRRLLGALGRGARFAGRERRGQDHADEHPGRSVPARRRPDRHRRRARSTFHSPRDAIRHGVGMVYQHYRLVPSQTVAENLLLGLPGGAVPTRTPAASSARRASLASATTCRSTRHAPCGSCRSASSSASRSSRRCSAARPS